MPEKPTRMASRFSWEQVSEDVLRALLGAIDEGDDPDLTRAALRRCDADKLRDLADGYFGTPLQLRWMDRYVADAMLASWLCRPAAKADLAEFAEVLALHLPRLRRPSLKTQKARIDFVRSRRKTGFYLKELLRLFRRAHRVRTSVEVSSAPSREAHPVSLEGAGSPPTYEDPYEHQLHARAALEDALKKTSSLPTALIVLPTGAGKTSTLVDWALDRMGEDSELRILWIAHQRELLDQAVRAFERGARSRPAGFSRKARQIYGGASPPSVLADKSLDVAAITIQTLASIHENPSRWRSLEAYLQRPTVVVVDEAHHVPAASYRRVLDTLKRMKHIRALVGLTATPTPSAAKAQLAIRERFGEPAFAVRPETLIEQRILARPTYTPVDTSVTVHMNAKETQRAETLHDLPPEVLGRLTDNDRDRIVRDTFLRDPKKWGPTLVFATGIDHADDLAESFSHAGVDARALHSRVATDRAAILEWFKAADGSPVLVSVGMLNEGVDLPEARSAFLARPTMSHVLLQQMIGRVMRGPRALPKERAHLNAEAHVVYFRDDWAEFGDVLLPPEAVSTLDTPRRRREGDAEPIPVDLVATIERLLAADAAPAPPPDEEAPLRFEFDSTLTPTHLSGYFDLGERKIPVFEHQDPCFRELLDAAAGGGRLPARMSFFDGTPPPFPSRRMLDDLVEYVRTFGEEPPLVDYRVSLGPALAADAVLAENAGPARARELIREHFDKTIAALEYQSFDAFQEAVQREISDRLTGRRRPDEPLNTSTLPDRRLLPRQERNLGALLDEVARAGAKHLPPVVRARLDERDLPHIDWTPRVIGSAFGLMTLGLRGRYVGRHEIRVNRLLRTSPEAVPDEALRFLIWHELLHYLLPNQGHDGEFNQLESRWPDAAKWNAFLDTLGETWDTDPKKYALESDR